VLFLPSLFVAARFYKLLLEVYHLKLIHTTKASHNPQAPSPRHQAFGAGDPANRPSIVTPSPQLRYYSHISTFLQSRIAILLLSISLSFQVVRRGPIVLAARLPYPTKPNILLSIIEIQTLCFPLRSRIRHQSLHSCKTTA
jgi:hypothetical protein